MHSDRLPEPITGSLSLTQQQLCNYLRSPETVPQPEWADARRLAVYRDLVFNNIESLVGSAYPVLRQIMGSSWRPLIRQFIADYRSPTPYFTQLASQFLEFLWERKTIECHFPFMEELARHEWLELDLLYREDESRQRVESGFDEAGLAFSPLADIAQYRYPVHRLSNAFAPLKPPANPTFLLCYRGPAAGVEFMQLQPLSFQLLRLISENPGYSARFWVESLARDFPDTLRESLSAEVLTLLKNFFHRDVLHAIALSRES